MKEWQFNILFFVGVGGAIFLLVGPEFGLVDISSNPTALAGVGSILTYILTQKKTLTKKPGSNPKRRFTRSSDEEDDEESDDDTGTVRRIESVYGDPDEIRKGDEP